MRLVCNQSGYDWVSEERGERKGGGVGITVKQGLRWEKLKSAGDRILWVRMEGIGCVGAVYLPDAHVALGDDADPNAVAMWAAVAAEAMRRPEVRALYKNAISATLARLERLVRAAMREAGKPTRDAKAIAAAISSAIEGAYLVHVSAPGVLPRGYAAPALHALVDGILGPG